MHFHKDWFLRSGSQLQPKCNTVWDLPCQVLTLVANFALFMVGVLLEVLLLLLSLLLLLLWLLLLSLDQEVALQ